MDYKVLILLCVMIISYAGCTAYIEGADSLSKNLNCTLNLKIDDKEQQNDNAR